MLILILVCNVICRVVGQSSIDITTVNENLDKIKRSDSLIIWDSGRKLKYADFQGVPDENSAAAAMTYAKLVTISDDDDYTLDTLVICVFDKSRSWIKPNYDTTFTLLHEQCHFDIGEFFARKLTKLLEGIILNDSVDDNLKLIYHQIEEEGNEMHKLYDKDTHYKRDFAKQTEWQKRISGMLSGL